MAEQFNTKQRKVSTRMGVEDGLNRGHGEHAKTNVNLIIGHGLNRRRRCCRRRRRHHHCRKRYAIVSKGAATSQFEFLEKKKQDAMGL